MEQTKSKTGNGRCPLRLGHPIRRFLSQRRRPLNQNKVPPLMPILMESLEIGLSQA